MPLVVKNTSVRRLVFGEISSVHRMGWVDRKIVEIWTWKGGHFGTKGTVSIIYLFLSYMVGPGKELLKELLTEVGI